MALSGVLIKQVIIKSDGDVFHELFGCKPHHICEITPCRIKGVDLHDGEWGIVGSITVWKFTHDGKEKVAKEVIEEINKEKKLVRYKVIGGDILEAYKSFLVTIHVDTKGDENLVTWTFEYEKLNESVDNPNSLMDFCLHLTKDIENHHLAKTK